MTDRGGRRPAGEHDTETMARVYLDQGKAGQAAAIYRRLIDRAGEDSAQIAHLASRLDATEGLRREARRRAGAAPAALPDCLGVDLCALVPLGPGRAVCLWEVTGRGREAARRQLGGAPGQLVLRLVAALAADPGGGAARWRRQIGLDDAAGERPVDVPDAPGAVAAAVGLRDADGGFAAIAHAAPAPLVARAPADVAPTLLEVEPAVGGPDADPALARDVGA